MWDGKTKAMAIERHKGEMFFKQISEYSKKFTPFLLKCEQFSPCAFTTSVGADIGQAVLQRAQNFLLLSEVDHRLSAPKYFIDIARATCQDTGFMVDDANVTPFGAGNLGTISSLARSRNVSGSRDRS